MSSDDTGAQAATENAEVEEVETEEVEETAEEAPEDKPKDTSLSAADKDELLKEITRLRKENAKRRTEGKQVEEAAKKWQQHVDSQKTELEKLQDEKKELEDDLEKYKVAELQAQLAKEHGVDSDLAEFIVGSDLDEMTEKAKKLAAKSTPKKTTAKDLRAGKTGAVEMDSNKWFKQLFE